MNRFVTKNRRFHVLIFPDGLSVYDHSFDPPKKVRKNAHIKIMHILDDIQEVHSLGLRTLLKMEQDKHGK